VTYFSQRLIIHAEPTKQVLYFSELYFNYYAFSNFQQKHRLNIFVHKSCSNMTCNHTKHRSGIIEHTKIYFTIFGAVELKL